MTTISYLIFWLGAAGFIFKRELQYLRFLQQEEYKPKQFLDWAKSNRFFDGKGTIIGFLCAIIFYLIPPGLPSLILSIVFAIAVLLVVWLEPDPQKAGKLKLNMTMRAKRIRKTALAIDLALLTVVILILHNKGASSLAVASLAFVALAQLMPLTLSFATKLLQPGEDRIQRKFYEEAQDKFKEIAPYTIGITGSYGKTSTKNMLGELLNTTVGPTFWPQKGVNTIMGITREIRERLSDFQKHAVIEMGAYRPGSIKRLCDFTPPHAGIVTAVGTMHFEKMGGPDGVMKAKSELPQAIPEDGILVCNADNPGSLKMSKLYPKKTTLLYGLHNQEEKLDSRLAISKIETAGTTFCIDYKEKNYQGFTKLHGESALSNILASFTMAVALGADPEHIIASIRSIEPVSNRLEVKRHGNYTQINDAYNSNPAGFTAALNVLKELEGKRKILVTPGMIELGETQIAENKKLAAHAADICDVVYVVAETNREAILEGLRSKQYPTDQIKLFSSRDDALETLTKERIDGDVVLLENDLPDLFEFDLRL